MQLHDGNWVMIWGGRRDFIGQVWDVRDDGSFEIRQVVWITRVTNMKNFARDGWKAEHLKDLLSSEDYFGEEFFIRSGWEGREIMPWKHGPPPEYVKAKV